VVEVAPEDARASSHDAVGQTPSSERLRQEAAGAGRNRRAGVASASVDNSAIQNYKKPVYPKDEDARRLIEDVLKQNEKMQVLFGHLKDAALADVVNAFFSKIVRQGEEIIRQGAEGDCLYIIERGSVDVFVSRAEAPITSPVEQGKEGSKVATLPPGALFGELALMYSSPRAATVMAASEEVALWALEQEPFKMLLAQSCQNTYSMYEGWLGQVEIFQTLNHYELSTVSDLLESNLYTEGEVVITQGEPGDRFYILEDGECAAFISGPSGEKQVATYSQQGQFFGELALLNNEPRKATVRAVGEGCVLLSLAKDDFDSVLGPIKDILKKHADKYAELLQ